MHFSETGIIVLLLIILILVAYIASLHILLYKKKKILEQVYEKMHELDNNWNKDDLLTFLSQLKQSNVSDMLDKDHIFDKNSLDFIFENGDEVRMFIHYTKEKKIADFIMKDGFRFDTSLYKTTESVHNDMVNLTYKHSLRKHYGQYIMILGISSRVYLRYNNELKNHHANVLVEHILASELSSEEEVLFLLPPQYVKGYINYETGMITRNPAYQPDFDSPDFERRLKLLIKEAE
jgi:hypothetical protein